MGDDRTSRKENPAAGERQTTRQLIGVEAITGRGVRTQVRGAAATVS